VKLIRLIALSALVGSCLVADTAPPASAPRKGSYTESFDTLYNSLTVQREGSIVELRARSRRGEFLESAVDLDDPLRLIVPYTRSLFAAEFLQPSPKRVLMVGLGGAGFHRLFVAAHPEALLQSVELDAKVLELCRTRLGFQPTTNTPVAVMDGRMFIKRNREQWDWLILDAFRGGYVSPHLKTAEFYRECAARLSERGVFVSNLHETTALYHSDLKTITSVFPQVVLFHVPGTGNVVVCAVNYRTPVITDDSTWPADAAVAKPFAGRLNFALIRNGIRPLPAREIATAKMLTDDFAPVEFLNSVRTNNAAKER
jgi:spermidine synthase